MKREERYAKEDESDTWATICFVMSSEVVLVLGNCSSYVRVGASSVVLKFDSGSVETGLFVSEWEFSIGIEESTGLVSEPSGTKPCWGSGSMYVQEKKVDKKKIETSTKTSLFSRAKWKMFQLDMKRNVDKMRG